MNVPQRMMARTQIQEIYYFNLNILNAVPMTCYLCIASYDCNLHEREAQGKQEKGFKTDFDFCKTLF